MSLMLKLVPVPCDDLSQPSTSSNTSGYYERLSKCYRPILHPIFSARGQVSGFTIPDRSHEEKKDSSQLNQKLSDYKKNPAISILSHREQISTLNLTNYPPTNAEIANNLAIAKQEALRESPYIGPVKPNLFLLNLERKEGELEVFYSEICK